MMGSAATVETTYLTAIREALQEEMRADESVFLLGEDIGAYGGAFALCEEGRQRLVGIERADSVVLDPHKGMFLPYGTGCLVARRYFGRYPVS